MTPGRDHGHILADQGSAGSRNSKIHVPSYVEGGQRVAFRHPAGASCDELDAKTRCSISGRASERCGGASTTPAPRSIGTCDRRSGQGIKILRASGGWTGRQLLTASARTTRAKPSAASWMSKRAAIGGGGNGDGIKFRFTLQPCVDKDS